MRSGPVVSFEEVSRAYGKVRAVDRLSLELRPGKSVALLEPNGTLALAADARRLGRNKQYSVFSVALPAVLYLVIAPQTRHAPAYGVASTAETM